MDDYMFKYHVDRCKSVNEATMYLEIFSYSDPAFNTVEEHPLTSDEFENFLNRRGAFEPPKSTLGLVLLGGMRLILQQNAKHPETFAPGVISLKPGAYVSMVETFRLPYRGIESTSAVGPFFWAAFDQDEEFPHLQVIYRKSDVRKKGMTRGWELSLSHDMKRGITTGFCKGTPSSDIVECMKHLKACALQIGHPLLLPTIIFSHDMSAKTDIKQREARDWLRRLEHAVSMRTEIDDKESYVDKDGLVDFDLINRHLVECHSQVLWKRPKAYLQILDGIRRIMKEFMERLPEERRDRNMRKLHESMQSRLEFYRSKLLGIESYAYTTLQRLDIQRNALYNTIAQRESKLNFQMAGEQRKLAHASKRDSGAQKTIALMGAVFLPGAYVASLFSMTFFNFQNNQGGGGSVSSSSDNSTSTDTSSPTVSPQFWLYWVVSLPLTIIIVVIWWIWDRRREKRYEAEDSELEKGVENMEIQIQAAMRKRTMSKVATWDMKMTGD